MRTNVYNVIWADDECDTLRKDKTIRRHFNDKKIEVLEFVPTSEELRRSLERHKDRIDAVIVDANFSKEYVEYVEPTDISGLIHTLSFIELINNKRDIPFYLYTAKKVSLQQMLNNGEIDYFQVNNRLIQKGDIEELTNSIVKDVDHIHSVEHYVNKRYHTLLNLANGVDGNCEENLHQFLLDEARDKYFDKNVVMFNYLRNIVELIMDNCKVMDIIPSNIESLNNFKKFFTFQSYIADGRPVQKWKGFQDYVPKNDIMPRTIGYSLEKLIDIIQDGSHRKMDLNLKVTEYVIETETPFLFRACLYLVMDLLQWYVKTKNKIIKGDLKTPLFKSR